MNLALRLAASSAALVSLSQPALAQTSACIESADLADSVTYAMPQLIEGLQTNCTEVLPADSFLLSEGDAFADRFMALNDQAWPGARRFLMTFVMNNAAEGAASAEGADAMGGLATLIDSIDGEDLRPFIDAVVLQLVSEEIKPTTCTDVEKILPLLAPLPAENHGALLSTVIGFVADDRDGLAICPAP